MRKINKDQALNIKIGLLFMLLFTFFSACESEKLSAKKGISKFTILNIVADINYSDNTINIILPEGTDPTKLSPTIIISEKATINPASNTEQDFTKPVTYTVTAEDNSSQQYVVTVEVETNENIYQFMHNNKKYEIVRENKTWIEAAAFASQRGGYLAEINNVTENTTIFDEAMSNASITLSKTSAGDGGGASYLWIGGNDIAQEGIWIWNGNNDGVSTQFWEGKANGSAIGNLYNNWGNEPDDFQSAQDGLALALTQWPLGSGHLGIASQWNDVNHQNNKLYFVIEYNN